MSQLENDRIGRREVRKKKRINTFLNISIGIVAIVIVFISGTLFFGLGGDEEATPNNNNDEAAEEENNEAGGINEDTNISDNETDENNNNENELNGDLGNSVNDANNNEQNDGNNNNNEENNENNNNEENNDNESNENNNNQDASPADEDEWGPIGTAQDEPFELTQDKFSRDHVNWDEMERALEYATGISQSEMTVWRIENAGGENTVVGTVSDDENTSTPYQVELSWVEGEGWEPVSMEQLSSNPYGG